MIEKGNTPPTRHYDATSRRTAARATRHAILAAARALFLANGYARTSMSAIANQAGVHIDTIYQTIGRKPDLVQLLFESAISGEDEEIPALQRDYVRAIQAEPSGRRRLEIYAATVGTIMARLQPIHRVVQEAAAAEPALAALWTDIANRRAANMRLFVEDLARVAYLRPDLTIEQAADVIWSTNGPEFYTLLVIERGWPRDQFESWLADTWERLLLVPDNDHDSA